MSLAQKNAGRSLTDVLVGGHDPDEIIKAKEEEVKRLGPGRKSRFHGIGGNPIGSTAPNHAGLEALSWVVRMGACKIQDMEKHWLINGLEFYQGNWYTVELSKQLLRGGSFETHGLFCDDTQKTIEGNAPPDSFYITSVPFYICLFSALNTITWAGSEEQATLARDIQHTLLSSIGEGTFIHTTTFAEFTKYGDVLIHNSGTRLAIPSPCPLKGLDGSIEDLTPYQTKALLDTLFHTDQMNVLNAAEFFTPTRAPEAIIRMPLDLSDMEGRTGKPVSLSFDSNALTVRADYTKLGVGIGLRVYEKKKVVLP